MYQTKGMRVNPLSDLNEKHILITGGANGIGESMVRKFDQLGSIVSFCDLDVAKGRKLQKDLKRAQFTRVDLMKETEVRKWVDDAAAQNGKIDSLINNAAADPRIDFDSMTSQQWDQLFARNIRAYFITAQQSRKHFSDKGGSIINFSSITIHLSPASMQAYVATKAAAIGLSQSLARELGPDNIRVNTLSPGWIMTERQLKEFVTPAIKRMLRKEQCVPKLIEPDEIANVALFLVSDLSAAVTGQEILVDRGWACSG